MTHFAVGFSGLAQIVQCPGSLKLCATVPEETTEDAIQGTAAHWFAMEAASGRIHEWNTQAAPNGIMVTREMCEGAKLWASVVSPYAMMEIPLPDEYIHETCGGTPDAFIFDMIEHHLRVWEYKFGHGYVEEFENQQLIAQAHAASEMLGLEWTDPNLKITMTVVQPRCYSADPVRSWTVSAPHLIPYITNIRSAVAFAHLATPPTTTGRECLNCLARHECGTLQRATASIVDLVGTADSVSLAPEALGTELKTLEAANKLLEARLTGLRAQTEALLRSGKRVPHFALAPTLGRLKWKAPLAEIEALAFATGKILINPPEPITPTQAIALGVDETVISDYAERSTSRKLVQESITEMRKAFGAK